MCRAACHVFSGKDMLYSVLDGLLLSSFLQWTGVLSISLRGAELLHAVLFHFVRLRCITISFFLAFFFFIFLSDHSPLLILIRAASRCTVPLPSKLHCHLSFFLASSFLVLSDHSPPLIVIRPVTLFYRLSCCYVGLPVISSRSSGSFYKVTVRYCVAAGM